MGVRVLFMCQKLGVKKTRELVAEVTIDLVLNSGPGAYESWRRRVHLATVWPPEAA